MVEAKSLRESPAQIGVLGGEFVEAVNKFAFLVMSILAANHQQGACVSLAFTATALSPQSKYVSGIVKIVGVLLAVPIKCPLK